MKMNIEGYIDPKFESIRQVYKDNFDNGLDIGSSLAITCEGNTVVDIWGGHRDIAQTLPWEEHTIVNVFSSTKNMTSLCAFLLADKGELDFFAPVSRYWPEFAANNKSEILISHVMSHSSGLSGWQEPITTQDLNDWEKCCELLSKQEPWWKPGEAIAYHALTVGYLMGEVVRRISGQSLGAFFKENIADPLQADFHIGLDESHFNRVAEIHMPDNPNPTDMLELKPGSIAEKTFVNGMIQPSDALTEEWRKAEIPAGNGHGNARSMAKCMALMANGGISHGKNLLSDEIVKMALNEQIRGEDLALGPSVVWGLGFSLQDDSSDIWHGYFGNRNVVFWSGWGGSLSIADMDSRTSFCYTPYKMEEDILGGPRSNNLVKGYVDLINTIK